MRTSLYVLFMLLLFSSAFADGPPPPPLFDPNAVTPPIEGAPSSFSGKGTDTMIDKVSPGIYRLGAIQIDKGNKTISFPAEVNMGKGMLEYLLVRTGGKTHESLLRTKVEPYQLQIACLLIGLEGTNNPLSFQGDPRVPEGTPVEIQLKVADKNGTFIELNPTLWLAKMVDAKIQAVTDGSWVFTGSIIRDGRFQAQSEGSIVAIYHDPAAMIDNSSQGAESDKVWLVNEGSVPPVGTPVTVTIKPAK
ncbi:hypothetical protein OR1_02300 [Geobacter sp. OR-1]|uniref:YdjY domain-containing protein n=1 Tax=Geobacter sp. OR-1 TaxID=1266765 RepID=UPI00054199EE|nr:YdjY domain-containing protein [Geobacter sp. OR-1]GAM10015.1 hypothetical protein OR1_02300 [Geobacter sp. OR-1]